MAPLAQLKVLWHLFAPNILVEFFFVKPRVHVCIHYLLVLVAVNSVVSVLVDRMPFGGFLNQED